MEAEIEAERQKLDELRSKAKNDTEEGEVKLRSVAQG